MKYAFIALILMYLVTYGCSSDKSEEATESHEQSTPATVQHPPKSEIAAVMEAQQEPADVSEQVAVVEEAVEVPGPETAEQAQPVAEEQQTGGADESQLVVMPCGRMMNKADIPANAPCLEPSPSSKQDTAATGATVDKEQALAVAMQKMAARTNELVLATKRLVMATREMLNASKGVAVEMLDTEKENMEAQPDQQLIEGQPSGATLEKDTEEKMQEAISAANKAISAAIEAEKQK